MRLRSIWSSEKFFVNFKFYGLGADVNTLQLIRSAYDRSLITETFVRIKERLSQNICGELVVEVAPVTVVQNICSRRNCRHRIRCVSDIAKYIIVRKILSIYCHREFIIPKKPKPCKLFLVSAVELRVAKQRASCCRITLALNELLRRTQHNSE